MAAIFSAPGCRNIRVFVGPDPSVGGNPAPVWLDADALSTAQMQEHTRLSGHESVFVLKPTTPAHRLRMRYFVPKHEMEMCGHATVGALWLLHRRGEWDGAPVAIETLSGTVTGRRVDGTVQISQPRATVEEVTQQRLVEDIAQCLGIEVGQIVGPVLNAATSRVKTLVRLADTAQLHALRVDFARVESLCERLGSTGLYPYAMSRDETDTVSARQFPKSSGYPEDAATGIAAAALAWGLRHLGLVGHEALSMTVRQGEAMGSPSAIHVGLPWDANTQEGCWVGGEACDAQPEDFLLDQLCPPDVARAKPSGTYATFARAGSLLHTSGVVARENGQVITGRLAGPDDVARGQRAAVAAVGALLRAAQDELGSLSRVVRVVALNGYLQACGDFKDHAQVMDAASAALQRIFPDAPLPVRTTVGVASLPRGGVVEVSMVLETRD
ncbi:PhzF family phenazine biosynthesis protein [Variovorax boronicumulans]|uniref:PhzF family phenazine biosynthesis protein n=1 Tax=Variovorax boronicumulans TaxID=436515 RepID=A0AAW8E0D8_9BURK|nr:PhzF family phenazine biosynthesis isomerase [Variovorax boronicumulans]MDP9879469.1 PhzF family phenazine biosynthesis protein [Variovorax boronicumulans]MDP9918434.1 PhzF family phenazine biosynthesis protein [Variovorax boronicumulans]MDP9924854.1 PhzF family phenazine biosynthesis protein [Variovorax boronicumulans]